MFLITAVNLVKNVQLLLMFLWSGIFLGFFLLAADFSRTSLHVLRRDFLGSNILLIVVISTIHQL